MRLNHNMESLSVYKNYKQNLKIGSKSMERVSSGVKLNSAKDNPSKCGQSDYFNMQLRSLAAAQRNLQDGVSMCQTADSGMKEIGESLLRMKELLVQSRSDTMSAGDRNNIQIEIDQIVENIDSIAKSTTFNRNPLISSDLVIDNSMPDYRYLQAGANVGETIKIPLYNLMADKIVDNTGMSVKDIGTADDDTIKRSLNCVESGILMVVKVRGEYGAIQSRIESTATNLASSSISLEGAYSTITDADISLEMVDLAKANILQDTALAIMKQTNNFPKDVLSILSNSLR